MQLGQIFSSLESWRKLSAVNMKPKIAYAILKYTKKVENEAEIVEKQRVSLLHEVSGTQPGAEVKLDPADPGWKLFVEGFNEILTQDSSLGCIQLELCRVIDALDGKDDVLSVSDLARLEPFFSPEVDALKPSDVEPEEPTDAPSPE